MNPSSWYLPLIVFHLLSLKRYNSQLASLSREKDKRVPFVKEVASQLISICAEHNHNSVELCWVQEGSLRDMRVSFSRRFYGWKIPKNWGARDSCFGLHKQSRGKSLFNFFLGGVLPVHLGGGRQAARGNKDLMGLSNLPMYLRISYRLRYFYRWK